MRKSTEWASHNIGDGLELVAWYARRDLDVGPNGA